MEPCQMMLKIFFNLTDTILRKPDQMKAPNNLKEKLFSQGEQISKISKEILVKLLMLAYESIFQYDIENIITETFVTEVNENISTDGLI